MKKLLLKKVLRMVLGSQSLQLKVVFFILRKLAERTDNTMDDEAIHVLEKHFGMVDTADLD